MPVSYTIDAEAGLISTRCYGDVTLSEVLDHFRILKDDPVRPNHLDVFLDLRALTSSPTAQQIRQASKGPDQLRGLLSFGFCVIVANRDVIYGMARMWAVFVEPLFTEVTVLRSAAEAEVWLSRRRSQKRSAQTI